MHLVHTEGVGSSNLSASTILFNGLGFRPAVATQNANQIGSNGALRRTREDV